MSAAIDAPASRPTEAALSPWYVLADAATFVHRSVRHSLRSLDAMMTALVLPLIILLMFVYVFGGALDPGGDYLTYVVPGIILLCAGFGSADTSVTVATDMTTGVIDRFRSLPVAGVCVLVGHVVATVLRNLASTVVVLAVAVAIGFRPTATAVEWLAVAGILVLFMSAIGWLAAAFGLIARTAQGAAAFAFIVMFLPYVSSAFVPPSTMPGFLRGIAEHQPVTPVIETLRGLLIGTPIGSNGWLAVTWCVGFMAVGAAGSAWLFGRRTAR